jgi:hypothetical protein
MTIMTCGKGIGRFAVLACLFGLLASGCASKQPQPWNVSIVKKTPATIQVDLVGVRQGDKAEWAGRNITEYWSAGSQVRKDADKLSLNLKMGEPVVIPSTDPKWREWFQHGAQELLVIANLPGEFAPGGEDPRRKFLPLRSQDWEPAKKATLEIEVLQSRIQVLTPQKLSN